MQLPAKFSGDKCCALKMDGAVPKFDCYSDPATLGPRWTRWLNAFELFADGKGLILTDDASDSTKQR